METAKKLPKRNLTVRYFFTFWVFGAVISVWGPMLPHLAEQTNTPIAQMGIVFSMIALGSLIGYFIGGRLYDSKPGHPIIAAALFGGAIVLTLVPTVPLLPLLAGLLFCMGFCMGVQELGINTLIIWVQQTHLATYMNALNFVNGSGALLSPFVVAWLLAAGFAPSWVFRLLAMVWLLAAMGVMTAPSPKIRKKSEEGQKSSSTKALLLIASMFMLYVGGEVSFSGWLYVYATSMFADMQTSAYYLSSVFWAAITFGRLLAIPASLRINPRQQLTIGYLVSACSLGMLFWQRNNQMALWVGTASAGMGMAIIFPALLAYGEQRLQLSSRALSVFYHGIAVGVIIFPWLSGQIMAFFGQPAVMVVVMSMLLTGLGIFSMVERTKNSQLKNL